MNRAKIGFASNYIYPIVWSSPGWSPDRLPPPVHNVPIIYAAMAIDKIFKDEYLSWVVTNSILAVATAILGYLVAKSIASRTAATVAAAVFLLSPLTLWFTLNPLIEQSIAFLALLLVWGTVTTLHRQWLGVVVMSVSAATMAASRINMLVLVPFGAALLAILAARARRVGWSVVLTFAALSTGAYLLISALLPQSPWGTGVRHALASGSPADVTKLGWRIQTTVSDVDLTWAMLLDKAVHGLRATIVFGSGPGMLMVPLTVIALIFGLLTAPRQRTANLIRYWAVSFLGIYLVTGVLFQAAFRYLAPVTPVAIILAVSGAERVIGATRPRLLTAVAAVSAVAFLAASILSAAVYRSTAESEAAARVAAKRILAKLPPGSTLFLNAQVDLPTGPSEQPLGDIQWSYVAAPRPVLTFLRVNPPTCFPAEVAKKWNVTSVLVSESASPGEVLGAFCSPAEVGDITVMVAPTGDSYPLQALRSSDP